MILKLDNIAEDQTDYIIPLVQKDLTMENGDILHYRGCLYVPKSMVNTRLESEHDSKWALYLGQDKTIELVRRNIWWPGTDSYIEKYIQACPACQSDKSRSHRRYGLLSPLELPYAPWQSITMDFITDIPRSNYYTEIWVVIERFSKMAHFIPFDTDNKKAEDLAGIFARKFGAYTAYPEISSPIVTPGSRPTPGRTFCL